MHLFFLGFRLGAQLTRRQNADRSLEIGT